MRRLVSAAKQGHRTKGKAMETEFEKALARAKEKHAKVEALKTEVSQLSARREQLEADYMKARVEAVIAGKPLDKPAELAACAERIEALQAALPLVTDQRDAWLDAARRKVCANLRAKAAKVAEEHQQNIAAAYQNVADALTAMARLTGVGNVVFLLGQNVQACEIRKRLPPGFEDIRAIDSPADAIRSEANGIQMAQPAEALRMLSEIGECADTGEPVSQPKEIQDVKARAGKI